jgi:hypothetical protein
MKRNLIIKWAELDDREIEKLLYEQGKNSQQRRESSFAFHYRVAGQFFFCTWLEG